MFSAWSLDYVYSHHVLLKFARSLLPSFCGNLGDLLLFVELKGDFEWTAEGQFVFSLLKARARARSRRREEKRSLYLAHRV